MQEAYRDAWDVQEDARRLVWGGVSGKKGSPLIIETPRASRTAPTLPPRPHPCWQEIDSLSML